MKKDVAINIDNLTKEFHLSDKNKLKHLFVKKSKNNRPRKVVAINKLNLIVKKGEFLGIIGPNGAGKSTLLKMISKIYVPTSGKINVAGKISPFLELRVGFQPELTANDNLYLYGALLGMGRSTINEKYDEIVKFAGVKQFMSQPYKNFSTGMQMRLGFSITVHANSNILLIDEALSVGDEEFQNKCIKKMISLNKAGKTMVFVSHDLDLIKKSCDRVILMDEGKIISQGKPHQAVKIYQSTHDQKR